MKSLTFLLFFIGFSAVATEQQSALMQADSGNRDTIDEVVEIGISGTARQYRLFIPSGLSKPEAILFDFHGSGSHPQQHLSISNMQQVAEDLQALLVLPKAARPFPRGGFTWNVPYTPEYDDDVQLSLEIIASLQTRFDLADLPIFATGFSGGARMASALACKASDKITAVALVAGIRQPELDGDQCQGNGSPSILSFHSLDDGINPYKTDAETTTPPYWKYGVEQALKAWAKQYDCSAEPSVKTFLGHITQLSYRLCRDNSVLISYALSDGGHTWPGSSFPFPEYLGRANMEIDGTKMIGAFFQQRLAEM